MQEDVKNFFAGVRILLTILLLTPSGCSPLQVTPSVKVAPDQIKVKKSKDVHIYIMNKDTVMVDSTKHKKDK